ncbi:type IV pilus modification protein PilV [Diaphorobacter caeni]|uniref:type IV pilus modification protein PilV n=1 Tax=Diaphorobacter caeni TaxID=2784387 RepID=UPI00188FF7D2|nr:type IV pilus modification protein PilV [Diaphorobacter caeni]MBF5005085.1 type IV pilus modification protein PilV [Diaphorobacter caeni]
MPVPHSPLPSRQRGAGLIEVLVAVLVVTLGLLGAAGMHVRSVDFTMDTERRQMASMVATELLETMRSDTANILEANGLPKDKLGGYEKQAGDDMPSVTPNDCKPLSTEAAKRVGCWGERAKTLMPELAANTDVLEKFSVTATSAGIITVTVAWPMKKGQCLDKDGENDEFCTFTLRSRL